LVLYLFYEKRHFIPFHSEVNSKLDVDFNHNGHKEAQRLHKDLDHGHEENFVNPNFSWRTMKTDDKGFIFYCI